MSRSYPSSRDVVSVRGNTYTPVAQGLAKAVRVVVESLERRRLFCASLNAAESPTVLATSAGASSQHVALAVNAGGQSFTDATGQIWQADTGFVGGSPSPAIYAVEGTVDDLLYSNQRSGTSFDYALPVEAGQYKVRLSFAEPINRATGSRVFDVFAEGQQFIDDLDLYATAGLRGAVVRESGVMTITDGQVNLSLAATKGNAVVSGIEVVYVGAAPDSGQAPPAVVPEGEATVITLDNKSAGVTAVGGWTSGTAQSGYVGSDYIHDGNTGKGDKSVTYTAATATGAKYKVALWYTPWSNRATNVPVDIYAKSGVVTVNVNQQANGRQWFTLPGEYEFDPAVGLKVVVRTTGTNGFVVADGLRATPVTPAQPQPATEVTLDNKSAGVSAPGWTATTTQAGYYGSNYLHDGNANKGNLSATFTARATAGTKYKVSMWYTAWGNRATNVPVDVYAKDGVQTVTVNQRINGKQWFALPGEYEFDPAVGLKVVIRNAGTNGYVIVDGVRFTPVVSGTAPAVPTDLAVSPVTGSSVRLTWTDASTNETAFLIERREVGAAAWTYAGKVNANVTRYEDRGLANGKSYEWRVFARNAAGTGGPSAVVRGTPGPDVNFNGITWANRNSPSPIQRVEALPAVVDGKVYVFGGFSGNNGPVARTDVYDPATNAWTRVADMPERLTHVGVAVAGRDVYFAGAYVGTGPGYQQQFSSVKVWKYNVDSNAWSAGTPLPVARASGGLSYVNGYLYFFGGSSNSSNRADRTEAWKLKVDGGTAWESVAPMNNGRTHMGYVVYDNKVWAVGGQKSYDETLVTQNTLEVYDPATNVWTVKANLPRGLSHVGGATFVMGSKLIVIGGEFQNLRSVNTVLSYDFATDDWGQVGTLPFNSFGGVGLEIAGKIYHTTGSAGSSTYVGTPRVF